jgi:hypothetical protein
LPLECQKTALLCAIHAKKSSGENAFSGFLLGNRQNFGVVETCGTAVLSGKMPPCVTFMAIIGGS